MLLVLSTAQLKTTLFFLFLRQVFDIRNNAIPCPCVAAAQRKDPPFMGSLVKGVPVVCADFRFRRLHAAP